jgi:hypothetical protein
VSCPGYPLGGTNYQATRASYHAHRCWRVARTHLSPNGVLRVRVLCTHDADGCPCSGGDRHNSCGGKEEGSCDSLAPPLDRLGPINTTHLVLPSFFSLRSVNIRADTAAFSITSPCLPTLKRLTTNSKHAARQTDDQPRRLCLPRQARRAG